MDGALPPVDLASWTDYQRRRAQQFARDRIAAAGATATDWAAEARQRIDQLGQLGASPGGLDLQPAAPPAPTPPPSLPEAPPTGPTGQTLQDGAVGASGSDTTPPAPAAPIPPEWAAPGPTSPTPAPTTDTSGGDWVAAARRQIGQIGADVGQGLGGLSQRAAQGLNRASDVLAGGLEQGAGAVDQAVADEEQQRAALDAQLGPGGIEGYVSTQNPLAQGITGGLQAASASDNPLLRVPARAVQEQAQSVQESFGRLTDPERLAALGRWAFAGPQGSPGQRLIGALPEPARSTLATDGQAAGLGPVLGAAGEAGVPQAIGDVLNLVPGYQLPMLEYRTAKEGLAEAGAPPWLQEVGGLALPAAAETIGPRLVRNLPGALEAYAAASRRMGITPESGFSDVSKATQPLTQDELRAQAEARLAALNRRGNAVDAAADLRNARVQRAAHLQALEGQAAAAEGRPGAGLGAGADTGASGLTPRTASAAADRLARLQAEVDQAAAGRGSGLVGPTGAPLPGASAGAVRGGPPPGTAPAAEAAAGSSRAGASLLGQVLEVVNNYTLGGPMSLLTNLTSGLAHTALNTGEALASTGPRGAYRFARGALRATPQALREAGQVFAEGTQAAAGPLGGATRDLAVPGGLSEGRGALRTAGSWATRANAATDRAIWTMNEQAGRALGEHLGYAGTTLDDFAARYAQEATFAGKPSALGEFITKYRGRLADPNASAGDRAFGGFVYALAPYIRVPERVLRTALDLTSGGAVHLREALRADPAVRTQARGRIGVALATTLGFGYQAAHGAITGDGPADPDDRAALEARRNAAGDPLWRANSWKVEVPGAGPDGTGRVFWFPNRLLGAVGTQMSMVANAVDAYQRASAKGGGDVPAGALAGLGGVVNEVAATALGDSWLDDLTRFAERVRQRQLLPAAAEAGAGLATRPLAALAPVARATDPYVRDVARGDVLGQTASRVPLWRQTLPAQIDPTTGEPLLQGGTPVERLAGTTRPQATAVRAETARLGAVRDAQGKAVYSGVTPRTFDDPQLTYAGAPQDEAGRRVLRQAYGSETGRAVGPLLRTPAYQQATDDQKAAMLRRALRSAAVEADIRAGTRIARSPQNRADYEFLGVPHYAGIDPNTPPDDVRRENARIALAKAQLAAFRAKYPKGQERRGDAELADAAPEQYALARRADANPRYLEQVKAEIRQRVGVAPNDDDASIILAGTVAA